MKHFQQRFEELKELKRKFILPPSELSNEMVGNNPAVSNVLKAQATQRLLAAQTLSQSSGTTSLPYSGQVSSASQIVSPLSPISMIQIQNAADLAASLPQTKPALNIALGMFYCLKTSVNFDQRGKFGLNIYIYGIKLCYS